MWLATERPESRALTCGCGLGVCLHSAREAELDQRACGDGGEKQSYHEGGSTQRAPSHGALDPTMPCPALPSPALHCQSSDVLSSYP